MRVKILGCSGGIGAGLRTTSILIDDDILIDTGTGIGDLTLEEMRRIKTVFITHSHLDHTAGLPLLVDTIFEALVNDPLAVHSRPETIDAMRKHIFNWVLWPDFSSLPSAEKPVMHYHSMQPGQSVELGDRKVTSIEVNHTVPGAGFVVQQGDKVFAFSGDTSSNDSFWNVLNALPRVDALVVETAFSNSNEQLAWLARHYCPRTLALDLAKLKHDPEIYITHLKPGGEETIYAEILEAIPERKLHRLNGGEVLEF